MGTTGGAWCEVGTIAVGGAYSVIHSHDSDLWESVEDLAVIWEQHQRPSQVQLGITVHPDGNQELWIDDPKSIIGQLP